MFEDYERLMGLRSVVGESIVFSEDETQRYSRRFLEPHTERLLRFFLVEDLLTTSEVLAEILRDTHSPLGHTPSRVTQVGLYVRQKGFAALEQAESVAKAEGSPADFVALTDYANGVFTVCGDIFSAEDALAMGEDKKASLNISRVPFKIPEQIRPELFMSEVDRVKGLVALLQQDPTGFRLVESSAQQTARTRETPNARQTGHRAFLLSGAKFAERLYKGVYPLVENR